MNILKTASFKKKILSTIMFILSAQNATNYSMGEKEINTPHYVHPSGNYAIISTKNKAFFYDVHKKSSILLDEYTSSKNDIMAISDDGKAIFIMKKNESQKRLYRLERIPTQANIYDTTTGKKFTSLTITVLDDAIFGLKNLKKIDALFHYNNSFISMKYLNNTSDLKKMILPCKTNKNSIPPQILESGQNYYVSKFDESEGSLLQICSYNNQLPPIPIIYETYFKSTNDIEIFYHEQTRNILSFRRNNSKNILNRKSSPTSITFTQNDEYIIIKYRSTTDVITLDKKNHTIHGIVLPFSGDFIIKNGKAQIVDEDDETKSYFLYQDGYYTDLNTCSIDETYDEIFMTDTRKDPDGKKTKSFVFKIRYDKNNNLTLIAKKIPTAQENLFMYSKNNILTDVDFDFLSDKEASE